MKKLLVLALIGVAAWQFSQRDQRVVLEDGIKIAQLPEQFEVVNQPVVNMDDYQLHKIAAFNLSAKVLAKKNYYLGREAELSPTDLALGWGAMSDERILRDIDISQSGRFYFWRVESFPIPRKEIETHSANMHIIPANDDVAKVLKQINSGDLIELSGHLVNINSTSDSWYWRSSTTRNDTGNGACEVILVSSLRIITPL